MVSELAPKSPTPSAGRPQVTSYDSGYEFSLEHWLELRQLVDAEAPHEPELKALAKAS
ncbi:MAG: hypothetical protein WA188_15720 [Terriglobales bacterium]